MNLKLLRTFDASYPEHNDGVLDSGSEVLITQFNRCGTMLAVGHLHFTGTELKSSYLMMGVTSGHSDGHVTLI